MVNDKKHPAAILLCCFSALAAAAFMGIAFGAVSLSPKEVLDGIMDGEATANGRIIYCVRLPRVLGGFLAGAALAVSGAVIQAVLGNPLASPNIIGVNAGAGFAVVLSLAIFPTTFGVRSLSAFIGALAAVGAILGVSALTKSGRTSPVTLVMSGMAVSALFGAFTSLVLSVSNEYQVTSYLFWTMGGLANRRWEHVLTMLVPVLSCAAAMVLLSGRLDVMLLGDEQARALGIHSGRNRVALVLIASMCTAAIVCVTGPIGFVGLIVPHIMRMLVGPSHRRLCLASAFAGGVFLTLCDSLVRFVSGMRGKEFSVGIVTALLGAPYFLFLLARRGGGEAED